MTDAPTVLVQSVLYRQAEPLVRGMLESVGGAAATAVASGAVREVRLALGDCSPVATYSTAAFDALRHGLVDLGLTDATYIAFDDNLGHGGGHNALAAARAADVDLVLHLQPDGVLAPSALERMVAPFDVRRTAVVEARQVPYEHPKTYDRATGETPWCSFACAMVRASVLDAVGGFDAEAFFLHVDDVDLSWRIRLAGHRCVYQPSARVFHDKRPAEDGSILPSSAEEHEGSLGLMVLAHKFDQVEALGRLREAFAAGTPDQRRAVTSFEERRAAGRLPGVLRAEGDVGTFVGLDVAAGRF